MPPVTVATASNGSMLMPALCAMLGLIPNGERVVVSRVAGRLNLCRLFAALGFMSGAEIGVWQGEYSRRLCETIPGLQLTCVDPWTWDPKYQDKKNSAARLEAAFVVALARLQPLGCRLMRMSSLAAAPLIPDRSLDFVYIDGNHGRSHVSADLEAWLPKIRAGGILAGHDYVANARKPFLQVKVAVDEFIGQRGIAPLYVLAADKSPSFFWMVS